MDVKYSIVIPCYKSSETIEKVVRLVREELRPALIEFILVNDGSLDAGKTWNKIETLATENDDVIAVNLAKNSGQHNAIICGLNYAQGEYIIMMDDDMQTHPSQLHKLIDGMGEYDVVYAKYPDRKHSLFRRMGSWFNNQCERILIGKPKNLKMNSYYIMRRFVRDAIIEYTSPFVYLDGLVLRTTDNITNVMVEHFEREVGESGYTFKKLVRHWMDIIGFTIAPLKIALATGAFVAMGSIIGSIVILIRKLVWDVSVTGWASMMIVMCFLFGVTLLFLGLIGEYLGRLFMQVNKHPQYVVKKVIKPYNK